MKTKDFSFDLPESLIAQTPADRRGASRLLVIDLVDGEFVEDEKSMLLYFKGSANQKTIMVQETLESGKLILWNPEKE